MLKVLEKCLLGLVVNNGEPNMILEVNDGGIDL